MAHKSETYFFFGLFLVIAIIAFLIALPYLQPIVLAGAFAVAFQPFYKRFLKIFKLPNLAAWMTVIVVALIVVIPLSAIGFEVVKEAQGFYANLGSSLQGFSASQFIQNYLHKFFPDVNFDPDGMVRGALTWIIGSAGPLFANTLKLLLNVFICVMTLYYFLVDGPRLKKGIAALSPLPDHYDEVILNRLESTVGSVIQGSLFISILKGLLAGIGFAVFGIPNPALWGIVTAIASFVPAIGTAITMVPAVAYLFLTGQTVPGIGLAIWAALIVGLVDNILGPRILNRGVNIHPLAIFIAVIGGLEFFGPLGFLMGPLIFSLFFTFLEIYSSFRAGAKPDELAIKL